MADKIIGNNLVEYYVNGTRYLELNDPIRYYESRIQGGTSGTSGFVVLPGSGTTSVRCQASVAISLRVSDDLSTYIKMVPNNVSGMPQYGISSRVVTGTGVPGGYPATILVYPQDFRLVAEVGASDVYMCKPDTTTRILDTPLKDMYTDTSRGLAVFRRYNPDNGGVPDWGSSYYRNPFNGSTTTSYNYFVWDVGLGSNSGNEGINSKGSDAWKSSKGWRYIGNLATNFGFGEGKEYYDGYIYVGGSGYYYSFRYSYKTICIPIKITIPGLRRLLNYFPWAICKSKQYYSLNRSGGALQSKKNPNYQDRKNRP